MYEKICGICGMSYRTENLCIIECQCGTCLEVTSYDHVETFEPKTIDVTTMHDRYEKSIVVNK